MESSRRISECVDVGGVVIGGGRPIVAQTMCNTHTDDVEATVTQCMRMRDAGAQIIRITVPGQQDVASVRQISRRLRECGVDTPLVADIHFSSATALAVAPFVEKVRINPGNFHSDHDRAREQFALLLKECRKYGTAIRIGLNHGSLGKYISDIYGNTPHAMAMAAMEWIQMCREDNFDKAVVSLKSSNTVSMVQAYRELAALMEEAGARYPFHVGVTEAGGGESGRIKSCVGTATLLEEGIGDTIRVSLTEDPVNEIPVARYLAARYSPGQTPDFRGLDAAEAEMLDAACTWGPKLLRREIDEIPSDTCVSEHLRNEIMQAARRRFYRPEYIACPGCGRTMYDLQKAYEQVKERTAHLQNVVIAVMGCIVNGPGEMADADWGYVGEGNGKVSIYHRSEPVLRHVDQNEAIDRMVELIEAQQ